MQIESQACLLTRNELRTASKLSMTCPDRGLFELLVSYLSFDICNTDQAESNGHLIIVGDNEKTIGRMRNVIISNFGQSSVFTLPAVTYLGANRYVNQAKELSERAKALYHLVTRRQPVVILTSLPGLAQMTAAFNEVEDYVVSLDTEVDIDYDVLVERLQELGYQEGQLVTEPGYYALRGGIIDVFPTQLDQPLRIELFGDSIASLRHFDPATQRSLNELSSCEIFTALEIPPLKKFFDKQIQGLHECLLNQNIDRFEQQSIMDAYREGHLIPSQGLYNPILAGPGGVGAALDLLGKEDIFFLLNSSNKIAESFDEFLLSQIHFYEEDRKNHKVSILPEQAFKSKLDCLEFLEASEALIEPGPEAKPGSKSIHVGGRSFFGLRDKVAAISDKSEWYQILKKACVDQQFAVAIVCPNVSHIGYLTALLEYHDISYQILDRAIVELLNQPFITDQVSICVGELSEWVWLEDRQLFILPEQELSGVTKKRYIAKSSNEALKAMLASFRDLSIGSYVVHIEHGIGRYLGIQTLSVAGIKSDFLIIEYAGQDKVYVPVDKLDLVQKYSGADASGAPPIDRLKSNAWVKRKSKVRQSVKDLADKLIKIQAQRKLALRPIYSEPSDFYFEFEAQFPYEETDDQLRAISEVNADLERSEPMDRLVCGDVGFGKTEIALRAAMRAIQDGWQVMVLAPTTVLSFQHYRTFLKRFENFGVNISVLNRFVSAKEAKQSLEIFQAGKLDILIGTHRLLSKDVKPKRLGMIIVDEEQRFGVAHKETIKELRSGCDILTLTATPIPRSLHMSLLGLRDISVISTPPTERLPVKTYVAKFDTDLIRKAVELELRRGGQVFFVHNRVEDILDYRNILSKVLPGVDIRIAHGQMKEHQLEKVMIDFIERKFPVLLCTTIIESGLDIPNANTIIVNRADHFGLAALYQLRGRVGRASRQSYAYFLTASSGHATADAEKRLEILAAHQELGSGFHIANYDLEMRGSGNILGGEQSGHVSEVGMDLYTSMLGDEIARLRHEPTVSDAVSVEFKLNIPVSIDAQYIASESERLQLYKRLFSATDEVEVSDLSAETEDRFGILPVSCATVFKLAQLKIILRKMKVLSFKQIKPEIFECRFASLDKNEIAKLTDFQQRHSEKFILTPDFKLRIRPFSIEKPLHSNTDNQHLDLVEKLINQCQLLIVAIFGERNE
jgi:transcription-repair coupling factor (superfamily II helicase)